jgi:hypothetical protein
MPYMINGNCSNKYFYYGGYHEKQYKRDCGGPGGLRTVIFARPPIS